MRECTACGAATSGTVPAFLIPSLVGGVGVVVVIMVMVILLKAMTMMLLTVIAVMMAVMSRLPMSR